MTRPALRRCTARPDFATQVWGRAASLSRAASLPGAFDDLFSLAVADRLLSEHALRTPFVRVVRDGDTLPTASFTAGGGVGAGIADQVSDARLARQFADGATVVLQALHRTHAPLIDFARGLGADLGHPVQVNAYLTPPQAQGFSAHYDVHDVFVLQVAGEKRWRVHAPVVDAPLDAWTAHRPAVAARAAQPPVLDEVLRPGDALYLPRGYLHAAVAQGGTTAHLTVGVHVWTRRHLLDALLRLAAADPDLRASLPLGVDVGDPASLKDDLAATLAALAPRLAGFTADDVVPELMPEVLAADRAEPVGPLAQAAATRSVAAGDRLRLRGGLRVVLAPSGSQVEVRTQDGPVTLPAVAAPALERLAAGAVLAVGVDLGAEVARDLLRHSLAVPA